MIDYPKMEYYCTSEDTSHKHECCVIHVGISIQKEKIEQVSCVQMNI